VGVTEPLDPELAVMVWVSIAKVADIVCVEVTSENVYEVIMPWEDPSTVTPVMW
jgi:hypothetical protein